MESWTTMLGDEVTATQLLPLFENAREKKRKKALFGQKYFWAATKEERMKVHAKKEDRTEVLSNSLFINLTIFPHYFYLNSMVVTCSKPL